MNIPLLQRVRAAILKKSSCHKAKTDKQAAEVAAKRIDVFIEIQRSTVKSEISNEVLLAWSRELYVQADTLRTEAAMLIRQANQLEAQAVSLESVITPIRKSEPLPF